MLLPLSIRVAECPPVWEKLFIRLTVRAFRGRWSNVLCVGWLVVLGLTAL